MYRTKPADVRVRCTTCHGRGTELAARAPTYSAAYEVYDPQDQLVPCEDCRGTGEAHCPGCGTRDVEVEDLESVSRWCTRCWLREWRRRRNEARAVLSVQSRDDMEEDWPY